MLIFIFFVIVLGFIGTAVLISELYDSITLLLVAAGVKPEPKPVDGVIRDVN